jgi:hypothetical protein
LKIGLYLDLRWKKKQEAGGNSSTEGAHDVYASQGIISVITQKSMRWTGHVACMEAMRNVHKIFVREFEWEETTRNT